MLAPLTSSARFLVLGALLASPLTTLAAPKPAASNSALVAALQAVSPDPLGGRLGLVAASARLGEVRTERTSRAELTASNEADRKAYSAWKGTRKS